MRLRVYVLIYYTLRSTFALPSNQYNMETQFNLISGIPLYIVLFSFFLSFPLFFFRHPFSHPFPHPFPSSLLPFFHSLFFHIPICKYLKTTGLQDKRDMSVKILNCAFWGIWLG